MQDYSGRFVLAIPLIAIGAEAVFKAVVATAQLHTGVKPISSSRGLPLFAPSGVDSIMNAPLNDKRYMLMTKYSYNYFDVPTGQNIEIHYNIDELAHEYADMKVIN